MSDYTDWLGPAADDLTPEQLEAFTSAADAYYALPFHADRDPDDVIPDTAEDAAALTAILQDILGEGSLMKATRELWAAQTKHTGWIRAMAARGVSERDLEQQSGISRMSVRKRLGR